MRRSKQINFIGIGAQKSGTSWLYHNIKKLPDFTLLPIKELHYFDRYPKYLSSTALNNKSLFERINDPSWRFQFRIHFLRRLSRKKWSEIRWLIKYFFTDSNDNWYLSLYKECDALNGEITPSYSMLSVPDIQKMYHLAPHAKLILLLRNPIHRAWSQYLHERRTLKNYTSKSINPKDVIQFVDSEKQSIRSDYERTIKNYLSVYPSSQILIGFFDAIVHDPHQLMESIVDFIGGDSSQISRHLNLSKKFNVNSKIEMPNEVLEFLKMKYKEPIKRLASTYGSYFEVWEKELNGLKRIDKSKLAATMTIGQASKA